MFRRAASEPEAKTSSPSYRRPFWALLVILVLLSVACGTRRTDAEFAPLVAEGHDADLLNEPSRGTRGGGQAPVGGGQGGQAPDVSGIGGGGGDATDRGATEGGEAPSGPTAPGADTGEGVATGGTPIAPTGGQGGGSTGGTADDGPGGSAGGGSGGQQNTASDTGVTPTSIKVGNIVSRGGPLGPNVFSPPYFGAQAYFELINQRDGGINGRRVEFITCDDKEDPQANRQCTNKLVNEDQVFAMVAVSTRAYEGAEIVSSSGLPDVGGQPIGSEYWTYPGLFAIRGSEYPQDGQAGFDGKLYGGTLQFQWFKENLGFPTAGVVHYEIPESKSFAVHIADALRAEGFGVEVYSVNAALPNWDSVVNQMKADGVQGAWDTLDFSGKQNLCRSMERNGVQLQALVSTSQGWTRQAQAYAQVCRDALFAVSESRPSTDTSHPGVKEFRDTMQALYGAQFEDTLHQWHLEGWAAAKMFADAVRAQGPDLTRKGVIDWLSGVQDYTAEGLLSPVEWTSVDFSQTKALTECLVIAKWDDQAGNFVKASPVPHCKDSVPMLAYEPAT